MMKMLSIELSVEWQGRESCISISGDPLEKGKTKQTKSKKTVGGEGQKRRETRLTS